MNRNQYLKEVLRQLNNQEFYQKLNRNTHKTKIHQQKTSDLSHRSRNPETQKILHPTKNP